MFQTEGIPRFHAGITARLTYVISEESILFMSCESFVNVGPFKFLETDKYSSRKNLWLQIDEDELKHIFYYFYVASVVIIRLEALKP